MTGEVLDLFGEQKPLQDSGYCSRAMMTNGPLRRLRTGKTTKWEKLPGAAISRSVKRRHFKIG